MLYPNHSLPLLISGSKGSGYHFLVETIQQFAVEQSILSKTAPFIKVPCAYFSQNPEELTRQLFQNRDTDKNLFVQAKQGVLFLDQIQFLNIEAKSRLHAYLESNPQEGPLIICSVQNAEDTFIQEPFAESFPIHIHLAPLGERPLAERLQFIQKFFKAEAKKMKRSLRVNSELLLCLLLYPCPGGIVQLKNEIQLGCANAYVRENLTSSKESRLYIHDFPAHIRKGVIHYKEFRQELEKLNIAEYTFSFSDLEMIKTKEKILLHQKKSIYDFIDKKTQQLNESGINENESKVMISADIEKSLMTLTQTLDESIPSKKSLEKLVPPKLIAMVEDFLEAVSKKLSYTYPSATFYGLCFHLSTSLKQQQKKMHLDNDKMVEVIETHREEYNLATTFIAELEKEFQQTFTLDETIFITLFIAKRDHLVAKNHPAFLIAMHGKSTASSIRDVVGSLLKSENVYAYDLDLDKNMTDAYHELKKLILNINTGKGIVMLYDMGSLKTMAETIADETGIQIVFLASPTTLLALDGARKTMIDDDLSKIEQEIRQSYQNYFPLVEQSYTRSTKKKIMITLCMTGKGGALQLKNYLEKNVDLKDVDIIPLAISDKRYLLEEVDRLKKIHEIVCIIGTYNPNLYGISFISIAQLFETPIDKLSILLFLENIEAPKEVNYEPIYSFLKEQLPHLNISNLKKTLPRAIRKINQQLQKLSLDQELGLFMHLACSIARIQNNEPLPLNLQKDQIIQRNKRAYNDLKMILEPIEEHFEILFEDDELANVLSIVKRL